MTNVWQQIFALDARYNANRTPNHPNFRTLYIRRRNQLLKKTLQDTDDSPERRQYLKLRTQLLQKRYGVLFDQTSIKSRSISRISDLSDNNTYQRKVSDSDVTRVVPTRDADASRALVGDTSISENYAFKGVHHIFDQHKESVTVVKFAHNDRGRLLCASDDGNASVCDVATTPPVVSLHLIGHSSAVTGCDWSMDNDLIVTSSLDGTLRIWDSHTGVCVRSVTDPSNAKLLTCAFLPANNNMVIAGNSKAMVLTLNVSAGIFPKGGVSKVTGPVLSLSCDSLGNVVWAGDEKGAITSFLVESWKLVKQRRIVCSPGRPVTSLSWRQWVSREARDPSLLVTCAADALSLYRVVDKYGGLSLKKRFSIRHQQHLVRSIFCPIMSFREGACVVSGSEDSCVYFVDIEREQKPVVNTLQGHSCPVLGVSFNYDESLLASSDQQGLVIVWKKETTSAP